MYLQIQKIVELYSSMKCQVFIAAFLFLYILSGCQKVPTNEELMGVWVGNFQDKKEKRPLPVIFQFFPDSMYTLSQGLSGKKEAGRWKLQGNLLQIGDSSYHAYFRKGGKLNLRRNSNGTYLMFRRPEKNSQLFSLEQSKQLLQKKAWTNIRKIPQNGFFRQDIHTYDDEKLLIRRRYFYQGDSLNFTEAESFCYRMKETAEQQFIFFANGANCARELAARQILQLNEEQLALMSFFHDESYPFDGKNLPHLFYISISDSLIQPIIAEDSIPFFSPCLDEKGYLERDEKVLFENRDSLISHITHSFQHFPNSQSGKIEMYLTVDCLGHVGRVNLIQKDENGQPIYFAVPIVQQLFELTVSYPFQANPNQGIDSRRKLAFKIKEGALTEIEISY